MLIPAVNKNGVIITETVKRELLQFRIKGSMHKDYAQYVGCLITSIDIIVTRETLLHQKNTWEHIIYILT